MAEAYYIFTDEAGAYNKRPSESFRRSHPFYIRANVRLSANDYRVFQKEIQELNTKYGVPVGEEIKWSDLWEISKGKYRADFLKSFTPDKLKGYYLSALQLQLNLRALGYHLHHDRNLEQHLPFLWSSLVLLRQE